MLNSAKTLGASLVSATGMQRLLHSRLHRHGLTIVMYHGVVRAPLPVSDWCFLEEDIFRQQIEYLSRNFRVLHLSDALKLLRQGAVEKPTAVVTFDDGYRNNFDVAFPVLKASGVPATIFLTTGFVDTADSIWFCHIIRALSLTRKSSLRWEDTEMDLSDARAKAAASARLQAAIKQRPAAETGALLRQIHQALEVEPTATFAPESPFRILDSAAIRALVESGLVEFGAHTVTHPILSRLSPQEQAKEIAGSVEAVTRLTGQACRFFAYPNGKARDYDAHTVGLLRNHGIEAAVTTAAGANDRDPSLLELQRYGVGADLDLPMFKLMVHHVMDHFSRRNQAAAG
jgi:peptidoglycan/xylan/chitin deacetylase (PgdA/CDA1 family)